MERHYHSCPECYQHVVCTMGCTICPDLCEGWDEQRQEFTGRLFGSPTECDECLKEQAGQRDAATMTWTSQRPTAGKWWVAIHPSKRQGIGDVLPVWVGIMVHHGDSGRNPTLMLECTQEDELLAGAQWLPRETPADPFAGAGQTP